MSFLSPLRHATLVALAALPLLALAETPAFTEAERGYWAFRAVPESVAVPELAPGTRGANRLSKRISAKEPRPTPRAAPLKVEEARK